MRVLSPYEDGNSLRRIKNLFVIVLTRLALNLLNVTYLRFRFFLALHLSLLFVLGTYIAEKISNFELSGTVEITEIVAYFCEYSFIKTQTLRLIAICHSVSAIRASVFVLFMLLRGDSVRSSVDYIISER